MIPAMATVLITGANGGLGKEAARQLAESGTKRVLLACRNRAKAEKARVELELATGKSVFEIVIVDVASASSVREAVSTTARNCLRSSGLSK